MMGTFEFERNDKKYFEQNLRHKEVQDQCTK